VAQPVATDIGQTQGAHNQPAVAMAADNKAAGKAGAAADKANAKITENKHAQVWCLPYTRGCASTLIMCTVTMSCLSLCRV
jgi:hypothetical protein